MIGIAIELIISWILLRFVEQEDLTVLGIRPSCGRIKNLAESLLLACIVCVLYHLMTVISLNNSWILNQQISFSVILSGAFWVLKSVLFEELIFRGALLYLAIKKIGTKMACILSAICFGIYHWFSYGAFGNPFQMAVIFLITGLFGFVLALGFAKTRSLYLPIGLHLGWNISNILIFSNGPLGDQILVKANTNHHEGLVSLLIFLFQILALPVLSYLYINKFAKTESSRQTVT